VHTSRPSALYVYLLTKTVYKLIHPSHDSFLCDMNDLQTCVYSLMSKIQFENSECVCERGEKETQKMIEGGRDGREKERGEGGGGEITERARTREKNCERNRKRDREI